MPRFNPSSTDKRPSSWESGRGITYEFTHKGLSNSDTFLFNPQTVLNELGIGVQKRLIILGLFQKELAQIFQNL